MTDIILPLSLKFARARFRHVENVGISRATYTGKVNTSDLGGSRVACSLDVTPSKDAERRALIAFLNQCGRRNRVLMYDPAYRPAGSFPAPELLTNADFAQGTTGWTIYNSTLTATNGRLRATATGTATDFGVSQVPQSPTAFAPYCLRSVVVSSNLGADQLLLEANDGVIYQSTIAARTGYNNRALVTSGTSWTGVYPAWHNSNGMVRAGRYLDIGFTSLARCILADGGPNLLLQSQTFQTTWSTTGCNAIIQNVVTAPDGTATADGLQENSATSEHFITQTYTKAATAQDFAFTCYVKRDGVRNVQLYLAEAGGAASCNFDLGTGSVGTPGSSGTFSGPRAFIQSAGDGWFRCSIVVRTGTQTALTANMYILNASNVANYAGDGASGLRIWGASLAQSGNPTRYTPTTTAAAAAAAQNGSAIYVKGLPASTSGLLLAGDQVEITTSAGPELKFVTADLDSDAAGLGYLQFAPALRGTVADNAPIIVNRPMGRFIFTGEVPEWLTEPGVISTSSFDFEEA